MRKILSFIILFIFIFTFNSFSQIEPDSVAIKLGKGWKLRLDLIPFGAIVQGSGDANTQLEAKQFIGSGLGLSFIKNDTWGINTSVLFYSGYEGKIYPLVALGGVLMLKSKISIAPCWDFGKIERKFDENWKERIKILVSYNLNLLNSGK